jgi:hypothetical protein
MSSTAFPTSGTAFYPVQVHVEPQLGARNRLTVFFRLLLALPHLILVGGPVALLSTASSRANGSSYDWGANSGVLGVVAAVVAIIAWFAIVITGSQPEGLWGLVAFYMRWRVRAVAYLALLRDEYPPFGDGPYPAGIEVAPPATRNRVTVAFRLILAIPQIIAVWAIGIAWAITTVISWFAILFTGEYPAGLYRFAVGALRWTTRVEAYLLLLTDDYPPFSLE